MEKITGNIIDNNLIEYNGIILTSQDLERHIEEYINTLHDRDDIYNKSTKAFNGLLLYLYRNVLRYIIPDTYKNDYDLYNIIFYELYVPLSYRFGRTCSINLFCILVN